MNSDDIKKMINETIDLVKEVPEEYRKPSFRILLKHALAELEHFSKITSMKKPSVKHSERNFSAVLTARYDWALTEIKQLEGISQYLTILSVAKNNFDGMPLSATDIKIILEQKFRIKKSPEAISMAMMNTVGKYVNRIKEDNKFKYRITELGEKKLEILRSKK